MTPFVSTGKELSNEWSHHRISSTDSKVRVTLQNSIKYSGSERVKPMVLTKPAVPSTQAINPGIETVTQQHAAHAQRRSNSILAESFLSTPKSSK